jgi:hypothetical protein
MVIYKNCVFGADRKSNMVPKDHSSHVCFKLTYWFQRRRLLNIFSIGSYVKIKSSHGGHPGYRTALTDTILKGTHPGTIPARFGLIWFSSFRGEDLNVRQPRPPFKMAAVTKNRNFFNCPLLL